MSINIYEYWMRKALNQAKKAEEINEVPVGAIVVLDEKIIAASHNMPIVSNDPTSHAEINAIRDASIKINNYRLSGATLYVTLEPCIMCYGAIINSRISKLVFGAFDSKNGVSRSIIKLHEENYFNHIPEVEGGVLEEECSLILKNFFKGKRG